MTKKGNVTVKVQYTYVPAASMEIPITELASEKKKKTILACDLNAIMEGNINANGRKFLKYIKSDEETE